MRRTIRRILRGARRSAPPAAQRGERYIAGSHPASCRGERLGRRPDGRRPSRAEGGRQLRLADRGLTPLPPPQLPVGRATRRAGPPPPPPPFPPPPPRP